MKALAIYVHVPFCVQKCAYCDFASFAGCEAFIDPYFDALAGEIAAWADTLCDYQVHSVFFGGGTPSLVGGEKIVSVLEALRRCAPFALDAEITLEANPGTLDAQKLETYLRGGVNRLSLGVQSFDGAILKALGRIHTPQEAQEAVRMAQSAGFENMSIDLMYALPGQDMVSWAETLDRALELPVCHISAYSLIVELGTPMEAWVREGSVQVPGDQQAIDMQRYAVERLRRAGLERYEISNFARPGRESRHNWTYWTDGEYLGLGSAAHSLLRNERFFNPPELARYLAGERMLERTTRSRADRKEEMLMLSTRTVQGMDLERWKREFGEDFAASHAPQLRHLAQLGLAECVDGALRLTPRGLELQDSVVLELMDD